MKTAKLFQNGQSQAVRLPKEFRFEGSQVYVQRVGNAVVLLPYAEPWDALFDGLDAFSADFARSESVTGNVAARPAESLARADA